MTFETKFRNFVGRLKKKELSLQETNIIADELLREYNSERTIQIDSWKGKSSFSFKEVGDNIIVTKYQRPEKGAEPKEVRTEIDLRELVAVENTILNIFQWNKPEEPFIKSTAIAEIIYSLPWKEIFSDRRKHNKFTIMLNVLDKKGVIEYKGGRVYLK